jgi:hypothetical protein
MKNKKGEIGTAIMLIALAVFSIIAFSSSNFIAKNKTSISTKAAVTGCGTMLQFSCDRNEGYDFTKLKCPDKYLEFACCTVYQYLDGCNSSDFPNSYHWNGCKGRPCQDTKINTIAAQNFVPCPAEVDQTHTVSTACYNGINGHTATPNSATPTSTTPTAVPTSSSNSGCMDFGTGSLCISECGAVKGSNFSCNGSQCCPTNSGGGVTPLPLLTPITVPTVATPGVTSGTGTPVATTVPVSPTQTPIPTKAPTPTPVCRNLDIQLFPPNSIVVRVIDNNGQVRKLDISQSINDIATSYIRSYMNNFTGAENSRHSLYQHIFSDILIKIGKELNQLYLNAPFTTISITIGDRNYGIPTPLKFASWGLNMLSVISRGTGEFGSYFESFINNKLDTFINNACK